MVVSVLDRGHLVERIVRSVFVVVDQELPGRLAHVFQRREQVPIQHLLPIGSVEALDVRVLVRFPRLGVSQRHPVLSGAARPPQPLAGAELAAEVGSAFIAQTRD